MANTLVINNGLSSSISARYGDDKFAVPTLLSHGKKL